jgi:type I site-specific restriction-modification system R (restriction) subunit
MGQCFQNREAIGFGNGLLVRSNRHLRDLLNADTCGRRIVAMIHTVDDMLATLNTRTTIFVLVDEAYRTTSGDLGNALMGALPNATFLGVTGSPIAPGPPTAAEPATRSAPMTCKAPATTMPSANPSRTAPPFPCTINWHPTP